SIDIIKKENPSFDENEVEKKACQNVREQLGGRILRVGIGGAPCPPQLLTWLRKVFPHSVSEGYGATEVGSIYINNIVAGSVKVKLVDWEEYTSKDVPFPRGEICVKTPMMCDGYFGDPEQTNSAFDADG